MFISIKLHPNLIDGAEHKGEGNTKEALLISKGFYLPSPTRTH